MTYQALTKAGTLWPYKKAYIKRRTSTGYEANWQDITSLLTSFGNVSWQIDNIKRNQFQQGSMSLVGRNDLRQWSNEDGNPDALFNSINYLTPYKTLFKLELGYYDTSGYVFPAFTYGTKKYGSGVYAQASSCFYGILVDEIQFNSQNEANININSLQFVLEEVNAGKLNPPATTTASNLVTAIRDVRDVTSTGSYILQQFITSSAWNIQTTTQVYTDFVSTGLQNYTCWSLLEKLAETENFVTFIGNDGSFYFKDRNANTTTVSWKFNGPGVYDPEYGNNIIQVNSQNNGWTQVFQRVSCKHYDADTTTSYAAIQQTFTVNDTSSSWKYGVREYNFENFWLDATGAAALITGIYNSTLEPKKEWNIDTKLIPSINLMDTVVLNYRLQPTTSPPALWGSAIWGSDCWTGRVGGIDANSVTCKIIKIEHDVDDFTSRFVLKEV